MLLVILTTYMMKNLLINLFVVLVVSPVFTIKPKQNGIKNNKNISRKMAMLRTQEQLSQIISKYKLEKKEIANQKNRKRHKKQKR